MSSLPISPQAAANELLRRRVARRELLAFTEYTFPEYASNWHHALLCSKLEQLFAGEIRRLMVFMPPRHGKSELVSRRFPAWALGRNPDLELIAASYSADLASAMNRDTQRIIDSPSFERLFPKTKLSSSNVRSNATGSYLRNSDVFEIVGHRGRYRAAGRGQGITGMGCDIAIVDDPLKDREEADSPMIRQSLWEWYSSTLRTRLSPNGRIVLCQTRWHPDDLAGRLLRLADADPNADQWDVIRFPAIAEDPLAPGDPREIGDPLWPARFSDEELTRIQAQDAREWGALYQQRPRAEGGSEWPGELFGEHLWFHDWPHDITLRVVALDPSKGKDARRGDYAGLIRLARCGRGHLWVEADLVRMPTTPLIMHALDSVERFQQETAGVVDGFGVEANQFQELLADEMMRVARTRGIMPPIYKILNQVNKSVRIRRLTPHFTGRDIHIRDTPGGRLLVRQLEEFPAADHDDGPDALEMARRLAIDLFNGKQRRGKR
ncbi:terminase large subunit domain-containing protein [Tuwongella immobilis]|uniref:Uncharacterized protein n=1 Tax=Tuwongella immobilis TaxID=692036 RepID=A0A6C2YQB7_9BACT|nr:terminase family protein [Tuwongella immobilis]VIP03082.1 Putative terminase large subunit OS=Dehalococcoides mccartyi BTF08 GN=btf_882 PE=4 SV=1: Terminase_6 [Tuwongella immobilis]VTS03333.1 Putative terminase large subunit OS=Dehalococcoides mccartyi BTF08 GN=btf_882 PE=4 SV=1: Terminase_6 [Tuwongella immobilis]